MTTPVVYDVLASVRRVLLDDPAIMDAVGDGVFDYDIPTTENDLVLPPLIILQEVGFTGEERDFSPDRETEVLVKCYHRTWPEARALNRQVLRRLQHLRSTDIENVTLLSFVHSGGPTPLREPETDWLYYHSSYIVTYADSEEVP